MTPPAQFPGPKALFRFGPYEFDAGAQTLTKHGLRLKVQGQPLQFLAALLESPGQTISREDLQRRLWPADTFVDFETGLNTAAKRLRAALSDSAEQPVYIETVARTGYRFIAPVQVLGSAAESVPALPAVPSLHLRQRRWFWAAIGILALGVVAASFLAARVRHERTPVSFRQLTFGRGAIFGAAFVPDGRSVVYSAQWDPAAPRQLYWNDGKGPESRALGFTGFSLAAISHQGELALSRTSGTLPIAGGELFKVPVNGGVPVAVDNGVMSADWSPDGRQLAIARAAQGRNYLEFPAGKVLYSTGGWISHVRFSPDGRHIAFLDHPTRHDDAGTVRVVSRSGQLTTLTPPWASLRGLAWRNDGELWYSAADTAAPVSLWATELSGATTRPLAQFPGTVGLRDVSKEGLALLSRDVRRLESVASLPGGHSRNVAAFDWSRAVEVDNRGRVLFDESGEAVGGRGVSFLSSSDGVARLDEGVAMGFSPDGESALMLDNADRTLLRLVRLEGGAPRELPRTGLSYQWARYFPDGRRLLALGAEVAGSRDASMPLRLWTVEPGVGRPRALTEPGMVRHAAISPVDQAVAYLSADGRLLLAGLDPSSPVRELAGPREPLAPIQWSADGRWLYVQHLGSTPLPARVSKIDTKNGNALQPWRQFKPADPAGVDSITRILISPDARFMVATFRRVLSELFVASGLR